MFVVSPAQWMLDPSVDPNSDPPPEDYGVYWPIVFENPTAGGATQPVDYHDSRDGAQAIADALNSVVAPDGSS